MVWGPVWTARVPATLRGPRVPPVWEVEEEDDLPTRKIRTPTGKEEGAMSPMSGKVQPAPHPAEPTPLPEWFHQTWGATCVWDAGKGVAVVVCGAGRQ